MSLVRGPRGEQGLTAGRVNGELPPLTENQGNYSSSAKTDGELDLPF